MALLLFGKTYLYSFLRHGGARSFFLAILLWAVQGTADNPLPLQRAEGYRGIWYANQPTKDSYVYKYSGGLGTYCMKHIPMAIYDEAAQKTFFVYGGAAPTTNELLEMVSYYDHKTGEVPRPIILMNKKTDDAHDNPVISMDDQGLLWVFASSHGTSRPSFLFKSRKPHSIDEGFDQVWKTNFSYPQPWYIPGKGFLFLHTRYAAGRGLFYSTSTDGMAWSEPVSYAHIEEGHYQVSGVFKDTVGSAFDYHPAGKGLNYRTNLYYLETVDRGKSWRTAAGETVETPVTAVVNPALIHDFAGEGLLVYVKDIAFDDAGRPAILIVTSKGWKPGPENGPYTWRVVRWTGEKWAMYSVTESDNNYDSGSLYLEKEAWRIIGPTDAGPQPFHPGGEVAIWTSGDQGATWTCLRHVTQKSRYNHSHVRKPLHAHPDFHAYWADGDTEKPSVSHLFFCDRDGEKVFQLPEKMDAPFAKPLPVFITP